MGRRVLVSVGGKKKSSHVARRALFPWPLSATTIEAGRFATYCVHGRTRGSRTLEKGRRRRNEGRDEPEKRAGEAKALPPEAQSTAREASRTGKVKRRRLGRHSCGKERKTESRERTRWKKKRSGNEASCH